MRFSIQPEPRPEQRMRTITLDQIITVCDAGHGLKPLLENYFSPTKKETFIKEFLHYINSRLLDAKHGKMDADLYLVFVLSFQFIAPLLEIQSEKELVSFCRILKDTYRVENIDINIHFTMDGQKEGLVSETEALKTYKDELKETYEGKREIKETVQKRIKKDAIEAIMSWQQEQSLPNLAKAFGRSVVIPVFFSCMNRKLITFYKDVTGGITYQVAIPEEIE